MQAVPLTFKIFGERFVVLLHEQIARPSVAADHLDSHRVADATSVGLRNPEHRLDVADQFGESPLQQVILRIHQKLVYRFGFSFKS